MYCDASQEKSFSLLFYFILPFARPLLYIIYGCIKVAALTGPIKLACGTGDQTVSVGMP